MKTPIIFAAMSFPESVLPSLISIVSFDKPNSTIINIDDKSARQATKLENFISMRIKKKKNTPTKLTIKCIT